MSVHEREPRVPRDDTGKGLRVIGGMLLAWTVFSLVWMPKRVMNSPIAITANVICFVAGVLMIAVGYGVSWLAPSDVELAERTHRLMEETHSGSQLEEPLFANRNGQGLEPKRTA